MNTKTTKMVSEPSNEISTDKLKLIKTLIKTRQELKHRQERINYNIIAGVCHNSELAQRKIIFSLDMKIHTIEYKLKNNLV